jgi:hypothetical protein
VCPKWFPCPWYIHHKPCTCIEPRLKLSPNRSKWAFVWSSLPRSTIRCVQKVFWVYGMFGANRLLILHQDWHYLQMNQNLFPLDPHHIGVQLVVPKLISEPMICSVQPLQLFWAEINTISKQTETCSHLTHVTYVCHLVRRKWFPSQWYILRKLYTYLALRQRLSPNGLKQASTWHTLPRITIGCAKSDFHARGAFGANHAPILCRV